MGASHRERNQGDWPRERVKEQMQRYRLDGGLTVWFTDGPRDGEQLDVPHLDFNVWGISEPWGEPEWCTYPPGEVPYRAEGSRVLGFYRFDRDSECHQWHPAPEGDEPPEPPADTFDLLVQSNRDLTFMRENEGGCSFMVRDGPTVDHEMWLPGKTWLVWVGVCSDGSLCTSCQPPELTPVMLRWGWAIGYYEHSPGTPYMWWESL